uniref:nebulin isoform X3 n=1 Tax=Myxine glutinosa TaxID=7769 RepID=UPI00358FF4A7
MEVVEEYEEVIEYVGHIPDDQLGVHKSVTKEYKDDGSYVIHEVTTTATKEEIDGPSERLEVERVGGKKAEMPQRKVKKDKTDTSTFMTPQLKLTKKMHDQFSDLKYKEDYEKKKHEGYTTVPDTPLLRRIKKAQDNISEVKYKKDGEAGRTMCHVDNTSRDVEHAKKVGQLLSEVLYKKNWEDTKYRYLMPPDAPEFVRASNNTKNYSQIDYKADFEADKGICLPYTESPELTRVAKSQKNASDLQYKKGLKDHLAHCTQMDDTPDLRMAKRALEQQSNIRYRQEYENMTKGKWAQVPCYDVAVAKMNSENISENNYKKAYEKNKAKVFVDTTKTPQYKVSKKAGQNASEVKYKAENEKTKHKPEFAHLPATENPAMVRARKTNHNLSDVEYKKAYEKQRGHSINLCETPQFKIDSAMKNFISPTKYKQVYEDTIKGHHLGSHEDPFMLNCKRMSDLMSDKNYHADYEEDKTKCYFPMTLTPEYNVMKKSSDYRDIMYKHPASGIPFTQADDSPEQRQAKKNLLQFSNLNYKAAYEKQKDKCTLPADFPHFLQSRFNAYNLSDFWYKREWEDDKANCHVMGDSIPVRAAKAHQDITSEVKYKKAHEKEKGHHIGAQSLQDDPKLVHYMKVAKMQSDREYKKAHEKSKTKYHVPLDMINVTQAKKAQGFASDLGYKTPMHRYTMLPDAIDFGRARQANDIQSNNLYKEDFNNCLKGLGWIPLHSVEAEMNKKAGDVLSEKKYRQKQTELPFTAVADAPTMRMALTSQKNLSDMRYKSDGEEGLHHYTLTSDVPQFIQARVNAINLSDNYYRLGWEEAKQKGCDVRMDAIPIRVAKASQNIASDCKYKQAYEKEKGHHIGAQSLQDDPKLVHYMKVAKMQSDREYKKAHEKSKTKYHVPLDMINVTQAKKAQGFASDLSYKTPMHHYTMLPDAINFGRARRANDIQSDLMYKADFTDIIQGKGWMALGSVGHETIKRVSDQNSEHKYRQSPSAMKFTSVAETPDILMAKANALHASDIMYKSSGEERKHKYTLPADCPAFIQSRVNAINLSDIYYKLNWEDEKAKCYDVKVDSIPIRVAKASRDIASDYKYKQAYEKERGHHVGAQSLEDDPKLVHSMKVAKIQSDREYKKDFEKSKTIYHVSMDMMDVVQAKKAQDIASDLGYKKRFHQYTMLPDAVSVELAKNRNLLQSDNLYKADLEWLRGTGWVPIGSLENEKSKKAMKILSEKNYRQPINTLTFTSVPDSMEMVQAKKNAEQINDKLYRAGAEEIKHKYTLPGDIPQFIQSRVNAINISDNYYRLGWEETKKKGCDMRLDAIPIKIAKASRDIASDYKYKQAYMKEKGHHVGMQSLHDDPKLVHSMKVAKMQSDREYKKAHEQSKTKYHCSNDMINVIHAKKAQNMISDQGYKQTFHQYTMLPDAVSFALARNRNDLQSDNIYKADMEWLRGTGWVPIGSLDVVKAKHASKILSERQYRQPVQKVAFTSVADSMEMELAKANALQMNDKLYRAGGEEIKHKYNLPGDIPQFIQSRINAINISDNYYKLGLEEMKKKGYDMRVDAIPIKVAKASRDIASDYKYKQAHVAARGQCVGLKSLQDDPKLVWSMHLAKMQSNREYKKAFEGSKTKYHVSKDMMDVIQAKKAQEMISDLGYKQQFHHYTMPPDAVSFALARNRNDLLSDNIYKADMEWLRGTGWVPIGSLDVVKAKHASKILSERQYRQPVQKVAFTSVADSMEMELAKANALQMNDKLYRAGGEEIKHKYNLPGDIPQFIQSRINAINISDNYYRRGWEETKKKGYDMRVDAIPIKVAKASRDIASDYKYKQAHVAARGQCVGLQSLQDDPKLVWSMHVAKIQSDREYKKGFEESKTKYHVSSDTMDVVQAKKAQEMISDLGYKQQFHHYTMPPDAVSFALARNRNDLLSDSVYKADMEWLRGTGWVPIGSLDVEAAKQASKILSERKYRQPVQNVAFTAVADSMGMELAKANALQMNDKLYRAGAEKVKHKYILPADAPQFIQSRVNAINLSDTYYRLGWEETKRKGYDMRVDAIPIKVAKASRDIASDYKYKQAHVAARGKCVGLKSLQDDPKLVWSMHLAKIQSNREYKKAFEQSKTKYHVSTDMMDVIQAKKAQEMISDKRYKQHFHHYTMPPDAVSFALARNRNDLLSDNIYKADMEWLRGTGWVPIGSLDVVTAKQASNNVSERKYRQPVQKVAFTAVPDSMEMELAKSNTLQMNSKLYRAGGEDMKHKYNLPADAPEFIQSRVNAINISKNYYKLGLEEMKKKGYDMRVDAIPIKVAKASRDIASDYKYKQAHVAARGQCAGLKSLQDDPKLVWSMHVAKMQSDREYKKAFEGSKTKYNLPKDMMDVTHAKNAQNIISDLGYKQQFHHYTMPPDAVSFALARNRNDLLSDIVYKADMEWLRGTGWVPIGSLDVETAKQASNILSERKYRQPVQNVPFTAVTDSMEMELAKANALQMNEKLYHAGAEKVKHKYNLPSDLPQFIQSRVNAVNLSDNYYKLGWEEMKKKGYDMRVDAIPIKVAKASRDIASDYKYKQAHVAARGQCVGLQSLQDDPKLVWSMHVAKIQSDREYKKGFEESKTKYHVSPDTMDVTHAKKAQEMISDLGYKQQFHHYTMPPDAVSIALARNRNDILSDGIYKSDLEWIVGIGWVPIGSLDVEAAMQASKNLSERKYRQPVQNVAFTAVPNSMEMELAKLNTIQMNDRMYRASGEKEKHHYTMLPDEPELQQAKLNAFNISKNIYRMAWEQNRLKGYDMRVDSIPIKAAKASRDIASDYKYKQAHIAARGQCVGLQSLQDDPKLVWYMHVAKMQSEREYKKAFEGSKTKYNLPKDMMDVTHAKNAQNIISDLGYKQQFHHYTMPPDAVSFALARNRNDLLSDNLYKSDLEWIRGTGWVPNESLEHVKCKRAKEILNDTNYRQHPSTFKHSCLLDSMDMVLAKTNKQTMNERQYKEAWEKDKMKFHIPVDTPNYQVVKLNSLNISEKLYKKGWEDDKHKGYDLRLDAIPIKIAKASRDIASNYKYKQAYEKEKGKHIGFRNIKDDPKLVWSMHVAKMQSDREYKKGFMKSKTKFNIPPDMVEIVQAKRCQELVNDFNYKTKLHTWTCLPDSNDVMQARHAYNLQSDLLYKEDLDWIRGTGWVPEGSPDMEAAKQASKNLSERLYRQPVHNVPFTAIADSMEVILAKSNSQILNKKQYKEAWDKDKLTFHIPPDTPEFQIAKLNNINISDKLYKKDWEESKRKGYDMRLDAIPIKVAKASRDIASDYKYKQAYEKEKGHYIGFRNLQDDPKLVWSMHVAKMQSDREYKKGFMKSKTKFHIPPDMVEIVQAKRCQELVNDFNYKTSLHTWTCLPDSNDVMQARHAYNLQSDLLYKEDLDWIRGMGWIPEGSLENEKCKQAAKILSEHLYRQPPHTFKFTTPTDAPEFVIAKQNAQQLSNKLYTEAWDSDKRTIHIMPDTPEIILGRLNAVQMSNTLYKKGWEESKKAGYDMRLDAIPIKVAKASRDIASDYKYKQAYEKEKGHHIGFRNIKDDPKLVWSMHVAKMQSDREYKKGFMTSKTKFNIPPDMMEIVQAKKCQELVNDFNYKTRLHTWTCLPDSNDVMQARHAYNLQSDRLYKEDLDWIRGMGWIPAGSLDDEKCKRASEILSEKHYRQPPCNFKFTTLPDGPDLIQAKLNAQNLNKRLYTEAWDNDKTKIHVMLDTPEILQARLNAVQTSNKLYKQAWEESRHKGYDMRLDAIPIKVAKASRDIASDYKYKQAHEKQRGHYVGYKDMHDDPRLVHAAQVNKMINDRLYRQGYENSKTKYHVAPDMLSVIQAKKCQSQLSDTEYRTIPHQYTCLPDQNDLIHARMAYDLLSDHLYREDLDWLRGVGWIPTGSLDDQKCKRAAEILNEKQYRQPPHMFKFTTLPDAPDLVQAKLNAQNMSKRLYTEAWDNEKISIHVMPDTPEIELAKLNSMHISQKLYKKGWADTIKAGHDMRLDAIPIQTAKASRDIASDYKYKQAYEKQKGHYVGFRNLQDDPKLVWSMHVAKMQSDREYKKGFMQSKTKFNIPPDMMEIVQAKRCQELVNDFNYKTSLHTWTCLPDSNDVMQARHAYNLQSDHVYKEDLDWIRGMGWIPLGSLDHEKCKRAAEILNEREYRQPPQNFKFTMLPDAPDLVQAKQNSEQISNRLYTEAWDSEKTNIHIMPDTPAINLARSNAIQISDKCYKMGWEEAKRAGCDMRLDSIPITAAKASYEIASDYKYKKAFEKQKGHYVGYRNMHDDPRLVHAFQVSKMQNNRLYRHGFEKSKTKYHVSPDMLSVVQAKICQSQLSDVEYRRIPHEWTCLPDMNDVIQARHAYDLQSDHVYKEDLDWIRGMGWIPAGSLDDQKCKRAAEILSEKQYRQPPDTFKFTSLPDAPDFLQAKLNAQNMSNWLYKEAWNKEKRTTHVMPDTLEIKLAKQNTHQISDKVYKQGLEEAKKMGCDMRLDAIPLKTAKASRAIASDYLYKQAYEKQKGHYFGFRSLQDDPKLVWSIHVAKMQSDREYKKGFMKSKTNYNIPVDMVGLVQAKACQELVSDLNYKTKMHTWTCLPDQNDVIQARKAYDLQSDWLYKMDMEWIKGCGWIPNGCLDVEKVQHAQKILSENLYRQKPHTIPFTKVADMLEIEQAKINSKQLSNRIYTEAWEKEKPNVHIPLDIPQHQLAKMNAINISEKVYKMGWEEDRKKGYTLPLDAIPLTAAKASRDIASDVLYKEAYEKQKGQYLGVPDAKFDPRMWWALKVGNLRSDLVYKKDYEQTKALCHLPQDMVEIVQAKKGQDLLDERQYRTRLHTWSCGPDQNEFIQARKAYDLQSDYLYKMDLEWIKGCGWIPNGSPELEKVHRAQEILSDNIYRQKPHTIPFTHIVERPELEQAKLNSDNISEWKYKQNWDKEKSCVHITPEMISIKAAKENSLQASQKLYRAGYEDSLKHGHDLRIDAIPIQAAKASREIASDYKYKQAYEASKGQLMGFHSVNDDPRMLWSDHVAKVLSDLVYKKDHEKTKTNCHLPHDMLNIVSAKKFQELVSDRPYRTYHHQWTCAPDQNDVLHARKAYDQQSDWLYKGDLEWLRGCGWFPNGSVDVKRVQNAQHILSENKYRIKPDQQPFSIIPDRLDFVAAKESTDKLNDYKYREEWNLMKSQYSFVDNPYLENARNAAKIASNILYKGDWESTKALSYKLPPDSLDMLLAQKGVHLSSNVKYKEAHEKQKGHYLALPTAKDDPKLMLAYRTGQQLSNLVYKKDYEQTKGLCHLPETMLNVVQAKKCQELVSDLNYRTKSHTWTCSADQNDVVQARYAYNLLSDALYKEDLQWTRGIGWIPLESIDDKRVKNAHEIFSDVVYKKDAMSTLNNFTHIPDRPEVVLAQQNRDLYSDVKYKESFNHEKGQCLPAPDSPLVILAKEVTKLASNNLYKKGWEKSKAKDYSLDMHYIPLQRAKNAVLASSEVKYKENYEKTKGLIGMKTLQEYPALTKKIDFSKFTSDLEYRKLYHDNKFQIHLPAELICHKTAQNCQRILSDLEYRVHPHEWCNLADRQEIFQARKAYDQQSDFFYKDDLNWIKGIGCYTWDTPALLHSKHSQELVSLNEYHADAKKQLQFYTNVTKTPAYLTALKSGHQNSEVQYKNTYLQQRGKYLAIPDTVENLRNQDIQKLYSNKRYKDAWETTKAGGYTLPTDSWGFIKLKETKDLPSIVKYRQEYEKLKAHYCLPKSLQEDPRAMQAFKADRIRSDLLYKQVYEKNKARIHIPPDLKQLETARATQKMVSGMDYRTYLHPWTCRPDLAEFVHARKVNEQLSDWFYKDDLNWIKGAGCLVYDTPDMKLAQLRHDIFSEVKYKAEGELAKHQYQIVLDRPEYRRAVTSGNQQSDVKYHHNYINKVRGTLIPTAHTVDTDRAKQANLMQSEILYRSTGKKVLPTGYKLPVDALSHLNAKNATQTLDEVRYRDDYQKSKARGYQLIPDSVLFEAVRRAEKFQNERLYRKVYHKNKDRIHPSVETPRTRQVKATQKAISDLVYKEAYNRTKGTLISMPFTPELAHHQYVGIITSDVKYKDDLNWLKGLGCLVYDTPEMLRHQSWRLYNYKYPQAAKASRDQVSTVLQTPVYRTLQELKSHLSEISYRAAGKEVQKNYTIVPDAVSMVQAKQAQGLQSQSTYTEVALKERPQYTLVPDSPAWKHLSNVRHLYSPKKYHEEYEKTKSKYVLVPDSPAVCMAKKSYMNASDLRYKEAYENAKGKYFTVQDAKDIVHHRKVTGDISTVRYKENYVQQLGIWHTIPDSPEIIHHRIVTDNVSDVKYKDDLTWLRGIGCYVWDTPDLKLAKHSQNLYSKFKYKQDYEKAKDKFTEVTDTPLYQLAKNAGRILDQKLYKADFEKMKDKYQTVMEEPRHVLAKKMKEQYSQRVYKHDHEQEKDKYTSVFETPENLLAQKVKKLVSQNVYKAQYNKNKAKWYTPVHDASFQLHMNKVKDIFSNLKYKEGYEKTKAQVNIMPDARDIMASKKAYLLNSNLDYKTAYERNKAKWQWTMDRPDFVQAAKASLQQSDVEYKMDREIFKGCMLSVVDDKNQMHFEKGADLSSNVKYKKAYEQSKDKYTSVEETPLLQLHKNVSSLYSENKYKAKSSKDRPFTSYAHLPKTQDTTHAKEMAKITSNNVYKEKFQKERGKSDYSHMMEPPEVIHAIEVAKHQSNIVYKKDGKAKASYTSIADRPDIKKASHAAKLISEIEYRAKAKEEKGRVGALPGRPDIELAKKVSNLTSMVKYKEKFVKEVKGKRPFFDPKESSSYKSFKDASINASEVKYKADLKKVQRPIDVAESLAMQHITSTSKLSSQYLYKKEFEKNKGQYLLVPDAPDKVHFKEASDMQSQYKYKEEYERNKGKAMLDYETPLYLTAKEAQHMQSEKEYKRDFEEIIKGKNLTDLEVTPAQLQAKYANSLMKGKEYKRDFEEGTKGRGLTGLEVTPDMLRAKAATHILNEKEYRKDMDAEIKGKGLYLLDKNNPESQRVSNATDILSDIKYKQKDMSYTSIIDTPDILHAQHIKTMSSQKQYKDEAAKGLVQCTSIVDTPEMQRCKGNKKLYSEIQYKSEMKNIKGKSTAMQETPELLRVKENQKNYSMLQYKAESEKNKGKSISVQDTPEILRVRENQKNFSLLKYKAEFEELKGKGMVVLDTPEILRVKENQKNFSSVLYKAGIKPGTAITMTPELDRVRRTQEWISMCKYKDSLGKGTAIIDTPDLRRVRQAQKHISDVRYRDQGPGGEAIATTLDMERARKGEEYMGQVMYIDDYQKAMQYYTSCLLDTPEMRRVRENQRNISSVKYHEDFEKAKGKGFTPVPDDLITQRVRKNTHDVSDISYRGIKRRVVEMEQRRVEAEPIETTADLRVWRTNPGSIFEYDPAEDNIQSKSLYLLNMHAQRRSREQSGSASALSISTPDDKSEGSEAERTYYFSGSTGGSASFFQSGSYQHMKTVLIPQQRSSSVATQQTTVSSIPSQPSTTGRSYRALYDYTAADADEATFKEGDIVVNVQPIDEGWMYGTVQRSGLSGMLPANYVEAV